MNNRNFIIGGVVAALVILAIGLFVLQRNGAESVVRRTVTNNQELSAETATNLQRTDRITTVLCGVASPIATDGAQTCTAVFVNGQFLLFDMGYGAMASMRASNLPLDELDAAFVTHYHNDHYADLGEVMELSWVFGRRHILPVHGPTGITQIVEAYRAAYEL